jgi:flagellar protein FliO/FliZ
MNTNPDMAMTALKMIMALIVVLAGIWVLYLAARRVLEKQGVSGGDKLIRVLETRLVGVKKSISVVEVPGALLVLGLSADNINLLARLDPDAVSLATSMAAESQPPPSFVQQWRRMFVKSDCVTDSSPEKSGNIPSGGANS